MRLELPGRSAAQIVALPRSRWQALPDSRHSRDHPPQDFTSLRATAKIAPRERDPNVSPAVPSTDGGPASGVCRAPIRRQPGTGDGRLTSNC
jgi:hypothetical protein